jgi:electron transfer flavoprotein beta subunit
MDATSGVRILTLVSVGRHPVTGRARRAALDARAVELGLRIPGAQQVLLHAGDARAEVLREYLGMGVEAMHVVPCGPGDDIVPALRAPLATLRPSLILTGLRAEGAEDSGMLPYLIAQSLGWPIVAQVVDVAIGRDGKATVVQALPRGRRREIEVALPCVLAVGMGAPAPRPSAFVKARRGRIAEVSGAPVPDVRRDGWQESPARARSKRLRMPRGGSAAARQQAATVVVASGGAVLQPETPQEAARAILEYLQRAGVR